ncbi:hypothetical protein HCH37_17480 [Sphingomonas melonis]|nr:hypothetical protein [Sphingomonas melonis]
MTAASATGDAIETSLSLHRGSVLFDAFALLITKATFIGLRLFVLYMIAATLGSAQFGPIAFALTTAEIVRFTVDWGIDTLSLRAFSDPQHCRAATAFHGLLRLKAVSSGIAFLLAAGIILVFSGVTEPLTAALIAITAATSLWLNLAINWLQARRALHGAAIRMCVVGAVAGLAQLGMHLSGYSYEFRFGVMVGFEAIMTLMILRLAVIDAGSRPKNPVPTLYSFLRDSTPIALATILALSYARFDQIYIRSFFSPSILGEFLLAARLVEPLIFVAASMTSTIYARASAVVWDGADRAVLKAMARKWIGAALAVSLTLAVGIGSTGHVALPRFFPHYAHTPVFLWITLAALPFRCVNLCLTAFMQALGQFGQMLAINLANFVNIAVLVILGGYAYGVFGAAIAVVLGEAINTILQASALFKSLNKGQVG